MGTLDVLSKGKEYLLLLRKRLGSDPAMIRYPFLPFASPFGNPVLCDAMLNKTFPYVHYPELKTRAYQRLNGQSVTERV